MLGTIRTPVLVLHGSQTGRFFATSAQYVVENAPHARGHTIPGAGHAGPLTNPDEVAQQLLEFFDQAFA
jgi:pimeloyl-ACP methyl ester carboxylesterase